MFGLLGKRSGKAIKSTRPEHTYEMNDDPVIGYVLLREPVSRDRIIEALNDHVSDDEVFEWAEEATDGDSLGCSIKLCLAARLSLSYRCRPCARCCCFRKPLATTPKTWAPPMANRPI